MQAQTKRTRNQATSLMRVVMANKAARKPAAIVGLAVTALLVGALLQSGQKAAHSGPVMPNSRVASKSKRAANTSKSVVKPASLVSASRRSVDFYTGDVRSSMFSEPVSPASPSDVLPAPVNQVRPATFDPLSEWNYTGTATIGDDKIAILENINTHDGVLLHMGDKFLGKKVTGINGSRLAFGTGSAERSLYVSMNTSYIPLSASAAYLTAKPTKPATPADNLRALLASMLKGNQANTAAAVGGPSVTLPNGRVLSGNALARYNRRLNRGWNGN